MGKTKSKPKKNGKASVEVMTLAEAAAFLRVAEGAVSAEAESGRLPAKLLGGEWRFGRSAILGWLESPNHPVRGHTVSDESPEEQEAFRAILRTQRDEVDRVTKSGRYAEE